ncbi:a7bd1859-5d22-4ce8-aff3-d8d273e6acf0 [Thermothielavioides terrestris]|uniref:A7bd1859-5d22-4ce8-aff3-d8d273e6acf0 n=1 Tax=Thermothielavioides terrestris TaxID=2587410 RepID=A0A3S5CXE1_9PEZI|nr:a7bd1859-5d22-4ce8-aff3-d8d273e6acf0 [Thermothielavioides terrestris]
MSSLKFVVSSLDIIAAQAGRNKQLAELAEKALAAIKENDQQLPDPEVVFAPLQLATKSGTIPLTTTALDCIGKLISYSYFSAPSSSASQDGTEQTPLIERAIDTICDCFQGETTLVEIQLQIVKSLLAAVLNDKIIVHGAGLLKAVRQVYNIFLLSRSTANQQVAQGTLTQMVGTVFERVKTRLHMKEARANLGRLKASRSSLAVDRSDDQDSQAGKVDGEDATVETVSDATPSESVDKAGGGKLTLKDLEHRKSFDDSHMGDGPTMVSQVKPMKKASRSVSEQSLQESPQDETPESLDAEDEAYIRDAYLVFRSFCNLSTKILPPDQLYDLRGQPMRSKLISLHLIHTLLNNHITVFTSPLCTIRNTKNNEPTNFLQAIKYYLCLSITRNGASSVDRVFDICCEIFWLMLKYMRSSFKNEIEVFLNEIYLALLARRNAPLSQKLTFVGILKRLCEDPRALVELYLNYDCNQNVDNIFQTIVEDLSRFATASVPITPTQEQQYEESRSKSATAGEWQIKSVLPPPLSVALIATNHEADTELPKEYVMKRTALDSLVETLRSLVHWSQPGRPELNGASGDVQRRTSSDDLGDSIDPSMSETASRMEVPIAPATPVIDDDPDQLEKEKARKTAMTNAIKVFNFKPKHGIKLLIKEGFIPSDKPEDIARFLLREERLDKAQIGEYLGEGDQKNVDIMHAFVDMMDFSKKRFVDALREFLQAFRLPGEAQKIDRFMLKFAHRYVTGNPNAFANADTPYVLAYSVIMLNTDLHSSKVVKRMSKAEFIKNNRGINDNADLPDEYLIGIYDDIASNEIVLKSEREAAAAAGTLPAQSTGLAGLGQAFSNVGRDLQREAYVQQSEEISLRSEQLFRDLYRSQRKSATKGGVKFISATSFKHVGPMFDATWMSFFSTLSSLVQKTHNLDVNKLCLEGMKLATKIACLFDLSTPREAFISMLKNTANLNNPREMQAKNVEALKVLLDLAQTEGNYLKESWKDVLLCISQLDRLQLISGGVDESAVPDVSRARFVPPPRTETGESRKSTSSARRTRPRAHTGPQGVSLEIALESRSDEVIKSVDRIFTNTANLSRDAIIHFARALTEVSWDEIKVSGSNDSPRTYSLQKIVEISYYNMTRVRFEWSHIWDVLGEHFNRVGCHANTAIVFFALDSLRQLSMRFMEIEELAGFKFQKDFLKPFEHVMSNSSNVTVKDMVLRCLIQMIQARGENIRSGWRTMFGVFTVAAREPYESIVNLAYENVTQVYKTRFGVVISQGAFTDLIVCLTEFSKNMRFQKKSLQAMETLKSVIPTMLKTPECPLSQHKPTATTASGSESHSKKAAVQQTRTSVEEGFWFPVLFAFHDVLMTGEDLEVRSNALNYFFETLLRYGGDFPPEFWDILWRQQLYPIFMVLRSRPEMTNALNHEELSVWLSTTMIQALRNMITLFTHYFDALEYMLDRFLELLALCICQENDTIARIGSNCLQQLILQNVTKFTAEHWAKIVGAFCELFERTTAYQLFSATTINSTASLSPPPSGLELGGPLSPTSATAPVDGKSLKINGVETNGQTPGAEPANGDADGNGTAAAAADASAPAATPQPQQGPAQQLEEFKPNNPLQQQPVVVTAARRRFFNRIISRCVLQLLMIETVNELFSNDAVYAQIPSAELLRLMALLKKSFLFAKRFNADKDLRMRLWREGFMKQPPNLLKQESGSAATYVAILFRMFGDTAPDRRGSRADVEAALVPLCRDIIRGYTALDDESQHRNIVAWRPVVVDVLEGYAAFPRDAFAAHIRSFYPSSSSCSARTSGRTCAPRCCSC